MKSPQTKSVLLCNNCWGHKLGTSRLKGERSPNWKGDKAKSTSYVNTSIYPEDTYFSMGSPQPKGGYTISVHRYIMAQHLGRCLSRTEQVHHINGNRRDNRLENLQ